MAKKFLVPVGVPQLTTTEINALSSPEKGWQVFDITTNQMKFYDGTSWTAIAAGGVTGSGTSGKLAKFTGTSVIGDSIATESGGTITVAGTLAATTLTGAGSGITALDASNLSSGTVASARLPTAGASVGAVKSGTDITVDGSGNVSVNNDSHTHLVSNLTGVTTDSILGRDTAGTGTAEILTATQVRTILNVADGANNYVLPVASGSIGGVKSGTDITVDGAGNVSVVDDSHSHVIANVDGLSTALSGKVDISTLTTEGDIFYRNATTVVRLAKGTQGYVLTAGATTISWAAPAQTGHTIYDETSPLAQRTKLSFKGAGVVAVDLGAGPDETEVTIDLPGANEVRREYVVGTPSGDNYAGSLSVFPLETGDNFLAGGANLRIYVDGVHLHLTTDYAENGTNQFTFVSDLVAGQRVIARWIQGVGTLGTTVEERITFIAGTASGTYSGSLTVFDLPFTYTLGDKDLMVFQGTGLLRPGASNDYVETDSNTVTFNSDRLTGDPITLISRTSLAAGNADTVDGIHAATTPVVNQLLALDTNAQVAASALKNAIQQAMLSGN